MDSPAGARIRYVIAVVIYGTIGMILRYISFPSKLVVLCRGVVGSGFIACFLLLRKQSPDTAAIKANIRPLVLSGICLGLNWVFLFAAYRQTTVAIASLCNYMAPIIVLFLSPLLLRETLSGKKLICILAAFGGIVLVSGVLTETGSGLNLPGIALGLAAALGFVGIILCNKKLRDISSYDRAMVQLAVSALTVLPYVLIADRGLTLTPDLRSVLLTVMLGVVHTGFAYCLYFGSMGQLPVQTVSILGYIEPVVSVLCSALILGEQLTAAGWLGAVLILCAALASELMP